jgi:hypothetical protein
LCKVCKNVKLPSKLTITIFCYGNLLLYLIIRVVFFLHLVWCTFDFIWYWWCRLKHNQNLMIDSCRNQKTFRPKKSAPTGSKVGHFSSCSVRLLLRFIIFDHTGNECSTILFAKCRVLSFKNISMLHWAVVTWGKLLSCLLAKISMSG